MDRSTKIIVALVASAAGYMILARKAPAITQVQPNSIISARVMMYGGDMLRYGIEQGVDPALIASVMTVESGGNKDAHGRVGEIGLMQILPTTGMWIGGATIGELTLPPVNIRVGATYIRYCIDRKGGNVLAGIAGYNYGPGRVKVEGGKIIAPEMVLQYMLKVMSFVDAYRRMFTQQLGTFYTNTFSTKALIV